MGSRSRSRTDNISQSTQHTQSSNVQFGLEDIDGIAISGDGHTNLSMLDGGAITSIEQIASDALTTARSGFSFALQSVDNIAESFEDALTIQGDAASMQLETVAAATRSDSADVLNNVTRTMGIVAVAIAGIGVFFLVKK